MNPGGTTFFVIFGLFWSALVLFFDGSAVTNVTRQIAATHYPSTEGTVLSSEVVKHRGRKNGTTYSVSVHYSYAVGDQKYVGARYRYSSSNFSDWRWANTVVSSFPPGKTVPVYYDPNEPDHAVLAKGIEGSDLLMLTFLVPFNCFVVFLWRAGLGSLFRRWFKPVAGGVKLVTEPRRIRARMNVVSPLGAGLIAVCFMCFFSIFAAAVLFGRSHPSVNDVLVVWAIILFGGFAAGAWHGMKVLSGKYDLVIDELGSYLELPATRNRKQRRRVPFAEVQGVHIETITKLTSKGVPRLTYAPTLDIDGSSPASERLAEWGDAEKARQFSDWLRARLPLRQPQST